MMSTADGSLKSDGAATTGAGTDASGAYKSTTQSWDGGKFTTSFRDYGGMIVFEQAFPMGVKGTTLNASDPMGARDVVSSSFPSFTKGGGDKDRGYLAFASDMTGSGFQHGTGGIKSSLCGVKGFGPVCHFTKDLSSSVVVSSFSNFMAASVAMQKDGSAAYGAQGSITEYPAGWALSFVIVMSPKGGVNGAFEHWGDQLLHRYGKQREMSWRDYSLTYLGYSTDNGAYYYYQTEGHAPKRGPPYTPGDTYQKTLIDVKAYADSESIPYKYILLDSWWYYQGVGGGVTNWIGRPDVFPDGNDFLRNATGWPIMGHNRYVSAASVPLPRCCS